MNEDGMPLRSVDESSFEYIIVTTIPRSMNITSMRPAAAPLKAPIPAVKNIIMSIISVGKRPLQGMNELVTAAMTRSLGDSMMRQPVTPQALHPSPIHMVRACLPCAPHFLKELSRLNATLGR